ncbi:MAG: ATP-binding protein, partial [Chloroflexales bacterium]|nr:ATP-binding protein [Chloroflexales bacterium]
MPEGGAIYAISRWLAADRVCQIYIRDTGIGMNAGQLQDLFEPFRSRKAQGAGLGLYLSKQLVEQHGGRVTVHSAQSKGTIVVVQLPWRE